MTQKQLEAKKQAAIKLEQDIADAIRAINAESSKQQLDDYIFYQRLRREIAEKERREDLEERRKFTERVKELNREIAAEAERAAERTKQATRDLGLAFQSMFEDAIIRGNKFSDVLRGLALDLARLTLRKSVVEPLFTGLASAAGSFFGGLKLPGFQFGGEVPGPIGRPQLAVVHGGERITPQGRSARGGPGEVHIHINHTVQVTSLDPTTAAAVIQKNMPVISRSLISEISRGGRLAAAVGRKQAGGI